MYCLRLAGGEITWCERSLQQQPPCKKEKRRSTVEKYFSLPLGSWFKSEKTVHLVVISSHVLFLRVNSSRFNFFSVIVYFVRTRSTVKYVSLLIKKPATVCIYFVFWATEAARRRHTAPHPMSILMYSFLTFTTFDNLSFHLSKERTEFRPSSVHETRPWWETNLFSIGLCKRDLHTY